MKEKDRFWAGVLFTILFLFGALVMASSYTMADRGECIAYSTAKMFWFTYESDNCVITTMDVDKFLAGFLIIMFSLIALIPNKEDR